jgi:CBS domain-containing protein
VEFSDTIGSLLAKRPSNQIVSIGPEQTVYEALEILAQHNIGALLVISGDKLAGMISERDYSRKIILRGLESRRTKVGEIMTSPVVAVNPRQTIDECMAIMTENDFRHLPVLEGQRVLGVVSMGDLVKWIIGDQEETIHALEGYIAGDYPK